MTKRIMTIAFGLLLVLAAGFGAVRLMSSDDSGARSPSAKSSAKRILYWVAPMDPGYRRSQAGKSPMGMDLIPVYEGEDPIAKGIVQIDPAVINSIGVRSARVERALLTAPIHTVGRITFDEALVAHIHIRSSGWIERLAVRSEGEPVSKGDLLFEVYSPDLVNAQAEYLQALRSDRAPLIAASRERLRALDIPDNQIRALEKSRRVSQYVKVYAPISGVVTKLTAADGMYVMPATEVMALADLSRVWLLSDVFEADADRVRQGGKVEARSAFQPGTVITGSIEYVYPDLDPITRTVAARTVFENSRGDLKPGMFMTARIEAGTGREFLVIPREALISTGRQERVILALDNGRFQPAQVISGRKSEGKVEILSGLTVGEKVVVSGQFLINSESSFAGAALRMAPDLGERAAPGIDAQETSR